MSQKARELILDWVTEWKKLNPTQIEEVKQPESFTELVRQNYFALMNSGKINHMRLKELSFGQKPNAKELKLIASVLELNPEDIEKLIG